MPYAPVRAHTHNPGPPSWTNTRGLSYRQFNDRQFDPWLRRAYSDQSVKPFYKGPPPQYAKYCSKYGTSIRTDAVELIRGLVLGDIRSFMDEKWFPTLISKWHDFSVREREDHCLKIWEIMQHRSETAQFQYRRVECPELTRDWAEDPFNFQVLITSLVFKEDDGISWRHVPHKAWERLNDGTTSSSLPLSAGVRAFCAEGRIMRTLFLAQFTSMLLQSILGLKIDGPRTAIAGGVSATQEDQQLVDASQDPDSGCKIIINGGGSDEVKHCVGCFKSEQYVKLTCCAKCKSIGRLVWYCSRECQVDDWKKRHKQQCGKKLTEIASVSPPPSKSAPTFAQLENLKWLESLPRAVWGCEFQEAEGGPGKYGKKQTVGFDIPAFVRPYLPTLDKFVELRNRAIKEKDDLDVGLLGAFIWHSLLLNTEHDKEDVGSSMYLSMLANILEMETVDLLRLVKLAVERVHTDDENIDPLIRSCFEQLRTREPDPAYPDQNMTPSSFPFLDDLLSAPDVFYSFSDPRGSGRLSIVLQPKVVTPYDPALARLRSFAFRTIEAGGKDSAALGNLVLFAFALQGLEMVGLAAFLRRMQAMDLEAIFELEEGKVEEAFKEAEKRLEERTDEESARWRDILLQLKKNGMGASKRQPSTPAPAIDDTTTSKKKKNRKKTKAKA